MDNTKAKNLFILTIIQNMFVTCTSHYNHKLQNVEIGKSFNFYFSNRTKYKEKEKKRALKWQPTTSSIPWQAPKSKEGERDYMGSELKPTQV